MAVVMCYTPPRTAKPKAPPPENSKNELFIEIEVTAIEVRQAVVGHIPLTPVFGK